MELHEGYRSDDADLLERHLRGMVDTVRREVGYDVGG